MSGGIVQLVATGAQDTWLTGKPEISFFRSNYKRYTHYARSTERQIIQGNPAAGSISTIRFEKKGDLLSYVYFIAKDTSGALIPGIDWSKVIDKIELLIGGQVVDTQDITWMTQVEPVTGAQNYSQRYLNNDLSGLTNVINGFLPLKFFFCKDWSASLPLVALQYHDIELRITWNSQLNYSVNYQIYSVASPSLTNIPGASQASAQASPITSLSSSTNATVTISNPSITGMAWQVNPFAYSGATMQIVPGMNLAGSSSGGTILGATYLTVLSVTPTTTTSGSFYGMFSGTPTSTGQLTTTAAYLYTTTPYLNTAASKQLPLTSSFGVPAAVRSASIASGGGSTQVVSYTSGLALSGYIVPGMYANQNAVGGAGSNSPMYVSSITASGTAQTALSLASNVGILTGTAITTAGPLEFNAPTNQAVNITYSSGGSGSSYAAPTTSIAVATASAGSTTVTTPNFIPVGAVVTWPTITGARLPTGLSAQSVVLNGSFSSSSFAFTTPQAVYPVPTLGTYTPPAFAPTTTTGSVVLSGATANVIFTGSSGQFTPVGALPTVSGFTATTLNNGTYTAAVAASATAVTLPVTALGSTAFQTVGTYQPVSPSISSVVVQPLTGSTATATVGLPTTHGLATGPTMTVALGATGAGTAISPFNVSGLSPTITSTTVFTIPLATNPYTPSVFPTVTSTSASFSAANFIYSTGNASLTTSAAHGLTAGAIITISGVTTAGFTALNGMQTCIAGTTGSTIVITLALGSPAPAAGTGSFVLTPLTPTNIVITGTSAVFTFAASTLFLNTSGSVPTNLVLSGTTTSFTATPQGGSAGTISSSYSAGSSATSTQFTITMAGTERILTSAYTPGATAMTSTYTATVTPSTASASVTAGVVTITISATNALAAGTSQISPSGTWTGSNQFSGSGPFTVTAATTSSSIVLVSSGGVTPSPTLPGGSSWTLITLALTAAGSGSLATPAIALTAGYVNAGGLTLTLTTAQPHLLTATTLVTLATFTNSTNVNGGSQAVIAGGLTATNFALTISAPTFTYAAGLPSYSSLTYQTLNTVIYTVSGTPALGALFPGMYLPGSSAYTSTTGIGYLGPPTTVNGNPGQVATISLTYSDVQSITSGSSAQVTLLVPPQIKITSATAGALSSQQQPYTSSIIEAGWLQPGWSISGIPGTAGVGYISSVTASATTPLLPTASTGFTVLYPDVAPTSPTSIVSNMAVIALPPTGSIVTTSTSSSSVQNIIVYNASPTISAALAPTFVNSFLSANAPSGTGVSAHQITTVNYLSAGVAEISVAFWSTQTAGKSSLVNATGAVPYYAAAATPQVTILPSYPIVNVLLTSSGTMSTGQYALGFTTGNGQPQIPTVNAVYGSVFSLNTNQTGASIGAGALNASYASVAFSFIPSAYYAGVLSSATGALNTAGGTVTPIATTGGTGPLPSPGTSLLFTPAMTGTTAVAVPINPYISAVSSSTLGFQYPSLASATITQFPANSQFVAVPQVLAAAQISTYYPSNPSTKPVIQITAGCASTAQPIAVGQIVVGTGFSGSVTVSSVIQTNSSFNNGSGTAIIELALGSSAGAQSATGTGTAVFFINPTASLSPGVTLSGTGFNGTYQQLQYEAWCSYLYLDGAEREYFASTPMDMLITQINRVPINPLMTHEVNLAHPVKFLAFLSNSYTTAYATQGTSNYPPASSYQFKTQINGVDIGDSRSLFQWQDVPQYYHTPYGYKAVTGTAPVTLISYCLDTSKLQPTGTLNFSRLDSYRIVTPSGSTLAQIAGGTSGYIYAMNYNVLRIQKGMGGLLYSS